MIIFFIFFIYEFKLFIFIERAYTYPEIFSCKCIVEKEEANKRRMEDKVGEEVREVGCKKRRLENHCEHLAL